MREKSALRLLVFIPPHRALGGAQALTPSTVVTYVSVDASGRTSAGETPVVLLPRASRVDLVFDTSDVFVAAIDAPRLSDAKLRLALPNLLEDRLLADPADCHFAFTPPTRGSGTTTVAGSPKLPVAVIARGWLTRALDVLAEAGYRPQAAYDEIYTVPAPGAGVLSVRVDRGRGIARAGRHDGFAFDFDGTEGPPALLLAVRQLGIKRIHAYGRDATRFAALSGALGVQIVVAQGDVDVGSTEGAVNLLQGPFATGGLLGGMALPRLSLAGMRAPLLWAAAAAVVAVVGMNAYWLKLEGEARALRAQMEAAFRSTFPQATTVVDPVLQARRELNALRARAGVASAEDFSVLNVQATQLFALAPIGSIAGIEYRDAALRVKFKQGRELDANLQNILRGQAVQQGLELRFEADGSARLSPSGR
jgi:general secretion pathway protein L